MSSSMTVGRPPWVPVVGDGDLPFPDVVALDLSGDGKHGIPSLDAGYRISAWQRGRFGSMRR
ncbi:hypothetical protein AB0N06_37890 [Streptomyces sp. NPDC051020]|uniref:hypothetical protein n=1 Tax=Streptomyces sp. NPDC051020 TaxID=3155409 RepID=UPI00342B161C